MTKIVTTIGPASFNPSTLEFFKNHKVGIARLNFSHGTAEKHIEMGEECRKYGFELMIDTAGPKVLLGNLEAFELKSGTKAGFEPMDANKKYPYDENGVTILPCQFDIDVFVKEGATILLDDGKLRLKATKVDTARVYANVEFGGLIKPNKGVNLPGTDVNIPFLVPRDRELISAVLPVIQPEWIAPSFVKSTNDLDELNAFIDELCEKNNLGDYRPKICTKIEMAEAIDNFEEILDMSDMIMIARGDLAVEMTPINIATPFMQDMIAEKCREEGKPFIVATQILETMMDSPVPTRAEVSDLYRAIKYNQADYVMLSGETAAGQFPTACVGLMSNMISMLEGGASSKSTMEELENLTKNNSKNA
ncbi:MAG: pyruvate kinase [Patescibacteria group bacterium]